MLIICFKVFKCRKKRWRRDMCKHLSPCISMGEFFSDVFLFSLKCLWFYCDAEAVTLRFSAGHSGFVFCTGRTSIFLIQSVVQKPNMLMDTSDWEPPSSGRFARQVPVTEARWQKDPLGLCERCYLYKLIRSPINGFRFWKIENISHSTYQKDSNLSSVALTQLSACFVFLIKAVCECLSQLLLREKEITAKPFKLLAKLASLTFPKQIQPFRIPLESPPPLSSVIVNSLFGRDHWIVYRDKRIHIINFLTMWKRRWSRLWDSECKLVPWREKREPGCG